MNSCRNLCENLDLDSKIQYYLTAAWYRHKFQRDHPFVRDSFNLKFFEGESAGCCVIGALNIWTLMLNFLRINFLAD